MSILLRVREKFKTPGTSASGTSKSPSAGSAGSSPSHSDAKGTPSAGSAGASHGESRHAQAVVALSLVQEAARADVLSQLACNPAVQRAFVNRFEGDGTMIVTMAIRSVGTGELKIPAARFSQTSLDDHAALLGCMEGDGMIEAVSDTAPA